jgi:selenocysteine lyase/cysteine desulfurase
MKLIKYWDWTASGRLYRPIEDAITNKVGPFVGNTHSESSETGETMTKLYTKAREIIKEHKLYSSSCVPRREK